MFLQEFYSYNNSTNITNIQKNIIKLSDYLKLKKFSTEKTDYLSKDLDKIADYLTSMQKAMIKEFNFDPASEIKLTISSEFIFETITAYSYEVYDYGIFSDKKIDDFITCKNGRYKFKTDSLCYCEITLSVKAMELLTPKEIMACFLHEIGHAFQTPMRIYGYRIAAMNTLGSVIGFLDEKYDPKNTPRLIKILASLKHGFDDRNLLGLFNNQANETFADQFATSYGYGDELASALTVFDDIIYQNEDRNGDLVATIMDQFFSLIFKADHPSTAKRINAAMTILKREAKNPKIPPKYRKDLERKIADMDRQFKRMNKLSFDDSLSVTFKKALALLTYKNPEDITEDDWNNIETNQTLGMDYLGKKVL